MAPAPSESVLSAIEEFKINKNQFYGISLSKYANIKILDIFEEKWQYYPSYWRVFFQKWR